MKEPTKWVAIGLEKYDYSELFEHLSMNAYTFDVAFNDHNIPTLFVVEDEFYEVITILNDRSYYYEIL